MIKVELTFEQCQRIRLYLDGEVQRLWECPYSLRNDFLAQDRRAEERHKVEELLELFENADEEARQNYDPENQVG